MSNTNTTTDTTRRKLINLVQGGDGIVEDWIERVHYKADESHPEDYVGYCYHIPIKDTTQSDTAKELAVYCDLETCYNLRTLLDVEASTDEAAANMPIIDNGRYYTE